MVRIDQWENLLSQHINGVPVPTMVDAVRAALIDFCNSTWCDSDILEGIQVDPLLAEWPVPAPQGKFPVAVLTAWIDGEEIKPKTAPDLHEKYSGEWFSQRVATAQQIFGFNCRRPGLIRLVPHLSVAKSAILEVAFQPRQNAVEVENFLYEIHGEAISYGALARLHSHINAPYADPNRAGVYASLFESKKGSARQSQAGHQKRRVRTGRGDEF